MHSKMEQALYRSIFVYLISIPALHLSSTYSVWHLLQSCGTYDAGIISGGSRYNNYPGVLEENFLLSVLDK